MKRSPIMVTCNNDDSFTTAMPRPKRKNPNLSQDYPFPRYFVLRRFFLFQEESAPIIQLFKPSRVKYFVLKKRNQKNYRH